MRELLGLSYNAYLFQIAREILCDFLLIIFVQKFQTNSWQFVFILPYGVNTLRLQESDWSEHLSSCLYFVACFCLWLKMLFLIAFQGTCQSFLVSTICTNFVFLHSKIFKFLPCLGLIYMFSANQNGETFLYAYY